MQNIHYQITQGIPFQIRVYPKTEENNAFIIIRDPQSIVQFTDVVTINEEKWLTGIITQDNFMSPGIKYFQLFEDNLIKEEGNLLVKVNLSIDTTQDYRSKYAVIVEAIEAMIAGTASRAQKTVKVGDKEIQYMSFSELKAILDYFKGKLKEQEDGYDTVNNQMHQKYVFRIR